MARLGSFAAPVDLPDHLRPWQAAGLDALFLPGGLPADESSQPAQSAAVSAGASAPRKTTAAGTTSPQCSCPEQDLDWPEPWRGIASRLRGKPQIIITYASLTADVTGKANPARRKLFHSILAYTGWPSGTSLFWPCTDVPGGAEVARNIFLNGALSFGVSHVVCFGQEAERIASALFPPGAGDPEVRVIALPEPEDLTGLLPHELHRAVAALKALTLA